MPLRDRLIAALVAVLWGISFPISTTALEHFPPLLTAALRFTLLAIPALLFVPRPRVQLRWLLGVGLGIGVAQFGLVYLGMATGMPSGLTSIVVQASAPFTVILAAIWLRESIGRRQVAGVGVAVAGLTMIAIHRAQVSAALPVILTVAGALGWAFGNICSRQAKAANAFQLTMWMSVIPPIPLAILSLIFEGSDAIEHAFSAAITLDGLPGVLSILYLGLVASMIGFGLWNRLLARYSASVVGPFSMLVPVVGVLASFIAFGEKIDLLEAIGGIGVVGGVLFASVRRRTRKDVSAPALLIDGELK